VHQPGSGLALRPERAADAALFEIPGEAVGVGVDFDMVDAVADRALVGFYPMLASGPVQDHDLITMSSPEGAADTALLEVGGKAVGMGVNMGVVGILAVRAGHGWLLVSSIWDLFPFIARKITAKFAESQQKTTKYQDVSDVFLLCTADWFLERICKCPGGERLKTILISMNH
jgi:hypothetical protein